MNRKRNLGILGAVLLAVGGGLLAWAKTVYDKTEITQSFYYAMTGNSVTMSELLAAKDAAAATGGFTIAGWVLLAAGLFAIIMAIAVRSDVPAAV